MVLLLLLLFLQSVVYAQAQQNITLGSSLTPQGPNTSWLSPSGDFAFGFRPLDGNASFYLLAVWFDKTEGKTVAWYANGNASVPSGSRLQLTSDRVLSLRDPADAEVWSPRVTGVAYARMLDSGNFMLYGADGSVKWQSFASPSDTILPSQVLPLGTVLRSRLMDTDYSDGRFILDVQEDGRLAFYPVAVPSGYPYDAYWVSNTVGNGSQLVFNATGRVYFTLKSGAQLNLTSAKMDAPADFYHRATLDSDGVFRQYVYPKKAAAANGGWRAAWMVVDFLPDNICEDVVTQFGSGACGFNSYCSFNWNQSTNCDCPPRYSFLDTERKYKGCKPDFAVQRCDLDEATALEQYDLIPMDKVDWPLSDFDRYRPIGEDTCRKLCLTDCFCAVAVFYAANSTCWKKKLPLSNGVFGGNISRTVLLKVPRDNSSQSQLNDNRNGWKKERKHWILGGSLLLGVSVLVNLLVIPILFGAYGNSGRKNKSQLQTHSSSTEALPLRAFTYKELERATDGFHEELGRGASGVVYKGHLDEHRTCIAVKKIDKMLPETEKEFAVEVHTIGRTFHRNLVRLLGFCNEGSERLLLYEFMANGSLNWFLFGGARPSWNLRVHVALGVARGLLYLHEECCTQIIHCDIKPQNILLDDNLTAKISDFGIAKLLRTNQTQTTTGIRGTRGYVAPEWFKNMGITAKVDVYSFGVILLELVCCRRNVELDIADEEQVILTYWANDSYKCGRIDLLVEGDDEAIFNMKKVERFVAVALWCLQEEPTMRPTMLKVTQMLDGAVTIPTPPDPSSFISSLP